MSRRVRTQEVVAGMDGRLAYFYERFIDGKKTAMSLWWAVK